MVNQGEKVVLRIRYTLTRKTCARKKKNLFWAPVLSEKKINISLTYPHSSDNISLTSLTFCLLLFLPSLPLPYPFSHFLSNICLLTFFLISVFSLLFPSPLSRWLSDWRTKHPKLRIAAPKHSNQQLLPSFFFPFPFEIWLLWFCQGWLENIYGGGSPEMQFSNGLLIDWYCLSKCVLCKP